MKRSLASFVLILSLTVLIAGGLQAATPASLPNCETHCPTVYWECLQDYSTCTCYTSPWVPLEITCHDYCEFDGCWE